MPQPTASAKAKSIPVKLKPSQLQQHLNQQSFLPLYIVSGDEPLLVQEACDQIRQAARASGFTERESYQVGPGFDWSMVLEAANSLSLFGDRKIIEVRFATAKVDDKGKKAISEYLKHQNPDTLLCLILPKLDKRFTSTKWFQGVEQESAHLAIWPIDAQQLPQWIQQRMRKAGLQPSEDAIKILVDRVEGNLLAANQEIEKLTLLVEPGPVDAQTVQAAVADQSHYDLFDLVDESLKGNLNHALKMLHYLKSSGSEPPLILWALTRELRTLASVSQKIERGMAASRVFKEQRIWDKRIPLFQKALNRLSSRAIQSALLEAVRIDHGIKGIAPYDPWTGFENILLTLSGHSHHLSPVASSIRR